MLVAAPSAMSTTAKLPLIIEALCDLPPVHLLVVGGTAEMVVGASRLAAGLGVSSACTSLAGCRTLPVPRRRLLRAASAYEANAQSSWRPSPAAYLSSLRSATPDVVENGGNGFIVERTATSVRDGSMPTWPPNPLLGRGPGKCRGPPADDSRTVPATLAAPREGFASVPAHESVHRDTMRVVHVIRSDGFAGVERHVAVLARAQAANGDDVVIIGGDRDRMTATLPDGSVELRSGNTVAEALRSLQSAAADADLLCAHDRS